MSEGQRAAGVLLFSSLDLFAGPGGWDEGIRSLGIPTLGIEWDAAACETRRAADHMTMEADVAELDPDDFGSFDLLIGSPPCQAFSIAGKGDGQKDVEIILECARELARGADRRDLWRARCQDSRSLLVVEPIRWAVKLKPRWIALEQVPPVLELWEHFGDLLAECGYECWAGVLSAERYGVPQTRRRAFLLASLDGTPEPPRPTHQAYEFGVAASEQHTLEGTLLPWVSMAEALGWGASGRPSPTVHAGKTGDGRVYGSDTHGSAARLLKERDAGRWVQRERSGDRAEEGFDPSEMPSQALTSKTRSWTVHRPATTIAGDSRVFQPGGHHEPGKQSQNAVRVTIEEASILQGFRPDYPWHGSRTKQFEQIGNAVPPPLARSVVTALLGSELARSARAVAA